MHADSGSRPAEGEPGVAPRRQAHALTKTRVGIFRHQIGRLAEERERVNLAKALQAAGAPRHAGTCRRRAISVCFVAKMIVVLGSRDPPCKPPQRLVLDPGRASAALAAP